MVGMLVELSMDYMDLTVRVFKVCNCQEAIHTCQVDLQILHRRWINVRGLVEAGRNLSGNYV